MHHFSRRRFLKASSAGVGLLAGSHFLLTDWARAQSLDVLNKSPPLDKVKLRAIAMQVLQAAKAAGAKFADVRILHANTFFMPAYYTEDASETGVASPQLITIVRMGVRAVVGEAMGFAGGTVEAEPDKIAALAQLAVGRSKAGQSRKSHVFEFAAAPIVPGGSWQTPVEIDPFTVPLGEQEAALLDAMKALEVYKLPPSMSCTAVITWHRRDEVFASTEGSYIEQRTYTTDLWADVAVRSLKDQTLNIRKSVDTVEGGVGYEALRRSNLKVEWPRVLEETLRLRSMATKSVDVGRYDLVLSPASTANIVAGTLGNALQLDRALLLTPNTKGTTYAMPPEQMLGKYQVGSELVTLTADRSRPGANATVGWDSEGVKPEDFTLIKDGVVVDYITTRGTAPALRAWYESRQEKIRSHGCAAESGGVQPTLVNPNLTLQPAPKDVSQDDLIKDVKRGLYIEDCAALTDQQCLNTAGRTAYAEEIVAGKRTGKLVKDLGLQFNTPQFWKSVDGIGGPASAELKHLLVSAFVSAEYIIASGVSAVPIRARKINVVNVGKKS